MPHKFLMLARCLASLAVSIAAISRLEARPVTTPLPPPVDIRVDIKGLPVSERRALSKILEAAQLLDEIYTRQVWPGTPRLIAMRRASQSPRAKAELEALYYYKGPWLADGTAFIPGVPARRPIGDYYPTGATKEQVARWLATLSPDDRARAMSPVTAIERAPSGGFRVTPYGQRYASELETAARDLRQAARLTRDSQLAHFLQDRAEALTDDDYYASDVEFVGLKGPLDVTLAPYWPDDDDWFGVKTGYESTVGLVNGPATARVAGITSHLQEMENNLPLDPSLRGERISAAPVLVVDAIYEGGMSNHGRFLAVGYSEPEDLRVLNTVGARTVTFRNILRISAGPVYRPIENTAVPSKARAALQFDDLLDEILMVRLFDPLGPHLVTTTGAPIQAALAGDGAVAGQIRSMLLSLWGHRYLIQHGDRDARESGILYYAFLVPALARIQGSPGSPQQRGSTYILNRLLAAGAMHIDLAGHFVVDSTKADTAVVVIARQFVSLMAKGDARGVHAQLVRYGSIRPDVAALMRRIKPRPIGPLRFSTANELMAARFNGGR